MTDESESHFVHKTSCPQCRSRDNLAIYSDGHGWCFGCGHRQDADGEASSAPHKVKSISTDQVLEWEPLEESKRFLHPETFAHWKYGIADYKGERWHCANHFVDGVLIGQKLRSKTKDFKVIGHMDSLYGRWLWPKGGKRVVVTEGEIDALSVSQAQGNSWPVVSVPNGAQGAAKAVRDAIDWLESFESVVFMFDMDKPGIDAAQACARLLTPGKARIAKLSLKDPNEMLKESREKELISAIWNAEEYRPDGIVTVKDVRQKVLQEITWGRPWFLDALTQLTYGRRKGESYYFGAGTGVGKTDLLVEQIDYDVNTLGVKCGVLFLEQNPDETVKRILGKRCNKRFHIPDAGWTAEELTAALDVFESQNKVFFYDNFGACEWEIIREQIKYMAVSLGCEHIYLDHLTALAAAEEDERKALEKITAELAMLAKELNIILHVVSHLSSPDGTSHEEGGRVTIKQFKGSRAIGFWAHFMFGMERDQQAEDETERNKTIFRVLKDRYTGRATGRTIELTYNHTTGRIIPFIPNESEGVTAGEATEELF